VKTTIKSRAELDLEDPYEVREIFATEVIVVASGEGTLKVTLAVERAEPLKSNSPISRRMVVVGRLILSPKAATQLLTNLKNIETAVKENRKMATEIPDKKARN
jgi:hypothetical protein